MTSLISLVWWVAWLAFGIYCIMDWQKHSEQAFEAAGTPKNTALIIIIVGLLCCFIGTLYYWFAIKPKVDAAEAGGVGGPTGYPPQ
jgi:hypothetical protein